MLSEREVISTLEMVKNENLDVRTVTLGISLFDCASHDLNKAREAVRDKILRIGSDFVGMCDRVGAKYGIAVVNKRISVSPIAVLGAPFQSDQLILLAQTLDQAAEEVGIDFIGGFSALVEKGAARGDTALMQAIPEALKTTQRVCASVNVASSKSGINMDAVWTMGRVIKDTARLTADRDGLGAPNCVYSPTSRKIYLLWPGPIWEPESRIR